MANLFIETLIFMSKFIYFVVEATIRNIVGIVYVPQKDVNGEIVLITGAGSGVGRLLAIKFAALGATVVLADVNREANDAVAAEILRKGQSAHAYQCDCSKRKDVYQLAAKVKETVGDVTILINNAGIVSGKKLGEIPDDKVDLTFQVNTVAHFWTIKAFLPAMKAINHGHIVTVASGAGLFGVNGLVDYCASKFGAVGIHQALTAEFHAQGFSGIHTTCVCPFYINTGMFDGVTTRFPLLLPILEPEYATNRIMQAIRSNQNILMMPRLLYLTYFLLGCMPAKAALEMGDFFGVSRAMDSFKGRQKTD